MYGELAGVVGWCSGVSIVTKDHIVVVGVLFKQFPHYMTCMTR